ncbi:hypothetical protein F4779DRAFT_629681 [Xylariaceae sp. FL0662B]|nr:hypothetical protein F4779DRAFT_629681 [Xylariaceae sp. FL0662B]
MQVGNIAIIIAETDAIPRQAITGLAPSLLANRVSWHFQLRRSSMHVNAAYSSSMMALDMACKAMHGGDATMALVVGSNVLLSPESSLFMANMNVLSPDSKCFSFDARANGYARVEGVVALVVKPLRDALDNGDVIRSVIRASGSNQDGRTPVLTQPSADAQELLIRYVYEKAGLDFASTRYVEAHGSFITLTCSSAVKPNIGHLEGASGLASLLKAILVVEKGIISPTALFETMNPEIDAEFYKVEVPTKCMPWPVPGLRRVSVNCFGSGGSNSHVILDDSTDFLRSRGLNGYHHCVQPASLVSAGGVGPAHNNTAGISDYPNKVGDEKGHNQHARGPKAKLLLWTAADANGLRRTLYKLDRLAYTLAASRSILPWRAFAVTGEDSGAEPSVALVFTVQGAQYMGMGMELLQYPVFKESLERSDKILANLGCGWSVFASLCEQDRTHDPELSQPLCAIIQIALVDLLISFKLSSVAVVGYSSGEIAAAYAAGALSRRSACKVAYFRGLLAGKLRSTTETPGATMSANLADMEIPAYLEKLGVQSKRDGGGSGATGIQIACLNSPTNLTLSADNIAALKELLDEEAFFVHTVNTGVAYHSPAMRAITQSNLSGSGIAMISSVTGKPVEREVLTRPQYWADNLASPVIFVDAIQHLTENTPVTDLVEIGPHSALKRSVVDTVPSRRYHSALTRLKSPINTVLYLLGSLLCNGQLLSIIAANGHTKGQLPFFVDCPPYPFDHTRRYRHEPRLSKDFRFRQSSLGYLLGRRAHDWNPLQPRWRNWLSIETIPWLADHIVSGTTILPGAGMLVMAIEAVYQVAFSTTNRRAVAGIVFKTAMFVAPIVVGETAADATETELRLDPDIWTECFRADAQLQYEDTDQPHAQVDGGREKVLEQQRIHDAGRRTEDSCSLAVNSQAFYDFTRDHAARVDMAQIPAELRELTQSTVHPAILDTLMQLLFAQVSRGLTSPVSTLVPQRLANASSVACVNTICVQGTVYALSDDGSPLCAMEHLAAAEVTRLSHTNEDGTDAGRPLLYTVTWKPQLSSLSATKLQTVLRDAAASSDGKGSSTPDRLGKVYLRAEMAVCMAARNALKQVSPEEITASPGHVRKYAYLLRHIVDNREVDEKVAGPALEWLLQECEAELPECRILPIVARALPSVLRGKTDPLDLLFSTGAAESFYDLLFRHHGHDGRLKAFVDLLTHENPNLRILEVGTGTGGMTRLMLNALWGLEKGVGSQKARFSEYVYTDISPAFFEAARTEFVSAETHNGAKEDRIVFRTFDLEKQPVEQAGFESSEGQYDLVVAGSVLHATANLAAILGRVRKLLKPGGHLLLQEITAPQSACINVGFGLLEGWWMGTEWRRQTPLVALERWGELLCETGFSGVDLTLKNSRIEGAWFSSIVVSTAVARYPRPNAGLGTFQLNGTPTECVTGNEWRPSLTDTVVISESSFHAIRALIQRIQNLLWLTSPVHPNKFSPQYAIAAGKHIVSVIIESGGLGRGASYAARVLQSCFVDQPASAELEFIVRDGKLLVGSLTRELELDQERRWQPGPPLKLGVGTPGMLDTLNLVPGDTAQPDVLQAGEVEIEAAAWPVSFRDVLIALSRLDSQEGLGFESAGTITRLGPDCPVEYSLHVGDRVVMVATGCMRSHPRGPAHAVLKVPDGLSLYDSVSAINPGMTAYHVLVNVARLQPGEKILIYAAAGSTGQMAVAIAQQLLGAEVFATVGFDDKKQLLVDRFNIPDDHIFYSRDTSFVRGVLRVTGGCGVDVVLNSLSGDGLRASWECIAAYGRFVELGKADISRNSALPMAGFAKNVSFAAVDLLHISLSNAELTRALIARVLELVENGRIPTPGPLNLYPVGKIEVAFRNMESGRNMGRILVTMGQTDKVSAYSIRKRDWKFDTSASYIVVGGFGGLGRFILRWMAERGAKTVIVPSRSGVSSNEAAKTVEELENKGTRIMARRCDVPSPADLSALLEECDNTLPPIRGCVNAAMALQDAIFENMSYTQWMTTIQSKVDTSWNLHTLLPSNLDFFILLSSLADVYGPIAQGEEIPANGKHTAVAVSRASKDVDPSVLFKQASSSQERSAVVVSALKNKLARALGVDVEEVDARKGLSDYGVDSLMAVELRNWIRRDFGATVAVFEIMNGVPIAGIGELIATKVT